MAERYALVNDATTVIENVILLASNSDWKCPAGYTCITDPEGRAFVGGTWVGNTFHPPPVVDAPPAPDPSGLMTALVGEFGLPGVNATFEKYPSAYIALSAGNWTLLRATIDLMETDTAITAARKTRILELLTEHHIPMAAGLPGG